MEHINAIELIQRINAAALELRQAYGKRLTDKNSRNIHLIAARAKMEAYNEILQIVKEISNGA